MVQILGWKGILTEDLRDVSVKSRLIPARMSVLVLISKSQKICTAKNGLLDDFGL